MFYTSIVIVSGYTDLDDEFLQHIGGINRNSSIKVLDPDIDEDQEWNSTEVIKNSSYYDSENLSSTLQTCKNKFTIFSTNIQSIKAKLMNWDYL